MPFSKKQKTGGLFGISSSGGILGASGDRAYAHKKVLNLNIYKSKRIHDTKNDDNYERRVGMKELLFYMSKDP